MPSLPVMAGVISASGRVQKKEGPIRNPDFLPDIKGLPFYHCLLLAFSFGDELGGYSW